MASFFQRNRVFLLHLSFWCFYVSFYAYAISSRPGREISFTRLSLSLSLQLSFAMLVTYFNYFVLLPRYFRHQKAWNYLFEFAIPFAVLIFTRVLVQRSVMEFLISMNATTILPFMWYSFLSIRCSSPFLLGCFVLPQAGLSWRRSENKWKMIS